MGYIISSEDDKKMSAQIKHCHSQILVNFSTAKKHQVSFLYYIRRSGRPCSLPVGEESSHQSIYFNSRKV